MLIRAILLLAMLVLANAGLLAAPNCPVAVDPQKAPAQITEWYDLYVGPSRALAGVADTPRPTRAQVEELVDKLDGFHGRSVKDPLMFEALVQQVAAAYANEGDFKGLTSAAAEKIYRPGSGPAIDFQAICIDTRRETFPEDTFVITLFGVNEQNCAHSSLRGLVFTATLVNGSANGQCRPDYITRKMLIVPVLAGTNTITFVCNKAAGGCSRR